MRAWIVLVLIGCVACSANSERARLIDREITGQVLFESYSIDQTWSYKLSGMYIAADGTVWAYEQTGTPWYPEKIKPGELYEKDMLTKHRNAHQVGTVDRTLLRHMADLIKPVARGKVTSAAGSAYGNSSLDVAYLFNPDTSVYSEIILAGRGDRVATNSAPEAQTLLDYIRDVQQQVAEPAQ